MNNPSKFPKGWDEARVKRLLQHYTSQTEDEAVAEDEAVLEDTTQTLMAIPNALVPSVRQPPVPSDNRCLYLIKSSRVMASGGTS